MRKINKGIKKYFNILRGKGKPSRRLVRGMQGSVTIFLLVIMLPMLVFSFSIMDLCKIFLAKDTIASATDIALRSAAPSYDDVLKDMYGILATSQTDEELAENVAKYYTATLSSSGIKADDNGVTENFIKSLFGTDIDESLNNNDNFLKVFPGGTINGENSKPIIVEGIESSAVTNPPVLRRQIIEYMKYRGPVTMAAGLFEKINVLSDLPNQANTTNMKLDFEKKASSLSDSAIIAYSLLTIYRYNNDVLQNGSGSLNGLHNTSEINNLINIYKYPGENKDRTPPYSLDSFKTLSYSEGVGKAMDYLKKSATYVAAVGAYSGKPGFPSNIIKISPLDNGGKKGSEAVAALKEGYNAITGFYEFKELYDEIQDGNVHEDIEALKAACKGFSSSNHSVSDQGKAELGFKLLNAFAPMFNGTSLVDESFSKKCKQFMSNFEEVRNGDREKYEEYDEALSNDDYETLYDQLDNAIKEVKTQVDNFGKAAKGEFETGQNLLNDIYDALFRQYYIIEALLGKELAYGAVIGNRNVELQTLYKEFLRVSDASDVYKDSIKGITNENQRNSYMAQYNSEALDFSKLDRTGADVQKMICALEKQEVIYKKAMDDIAGIMYLSNGNSANKVINQSGVIILSSNENNDFRPTFSNKYIEAFNKGSFANDNFSAIISGVFSDKYVRFAGENYIYGVSTKHSNWKDLFNEVTDTESNPFYIELRKYATPAREAEEAGQQLKSQVESTSPVNENGVPSEVKTDGSTTTSNNSGTSSSGSGDNGWDVKLSDYPIYSGSSLGGSGAPFKAGGISGSDEEKATAVQALMNSISDFIGNLLQDLGESALISEYFIDEFSCHTTSMKGDGVRHNDAFMLTGHPFYNQNENKSNVVWYGAEQEYILYGLDSPEANIAAAGAVIFGIRFALNLAYSFTDAEIRAFTLSVATAAGGVFPPAIPLIQTALHIGLAIAESSWDLMQLMDGAEVPIFKTPDTWVCKGSNIVRNVAAKAIDVATEKVVKPAIDKAADGLCGIIGNVQEGASNFVSESDENFKALVNDEANKIKRQIELEIVIPLESAVQNVVVNYTDTMVNVRDMVKTKLKTAVNDSINALGLNNDNDGNLLKKAEKQVMDYVVGNIDSFADTITSKIPEYVDAAVGINVGEISDNDANKALGSFSQKIRELFDGVYKKIDEVTVQSTEFTNNISNKLQTELNKLSEKAKKGVKVAAEDIKEAVGNVSNDIKGQGHLNIDINSDSATGNTSPTSLIGMTYQDYLHIFMIIALLGKDDSPQLQRAGQLIYANVKRYSQNDSFDLNKTYTVIGAKSTASVKTVFFGSVFENGKLKMPDGAGRYSFEHTAYWGY